MTTYYVENRDFSIDCAVDGQQLTMTLMGIVYFDEEGEEQCSSPVNLQCGDTVDDCNDSDGKCTMTFVSNPAGGWTLGFQRKSGGSWGAVESELVIEDSENTVEWRVYASRAGYDPIMSDPFVRVLKVQPGY